MNKFLYLFSHNEFCLELFSNRSSFCISASEVLSQFDQRWKTMEFERCIENEVELCT